MTVLRAGERLAGVSKDRYSKRDVAYVVTDRTGELGTAVPVASARGAIHQRARGRAVGARERVGPARVPRSHGQAQRVAQGEVAHRERAARALVAFEAMRAVYRKAAVAGKASKRAHERPPPYRMAVE